MKKVLTILIILGIGTCSFSYAQVHDNQSTIHVDANKLFVIGNGEGKTVEQAKIAAIKDILNQISDENLIASLPSSSRETRYAKDDVVDQGLERLIAKLFTEGYWQLKDEIYYYSLKIAIQREIPEKDQ